MERIRIKKRKQKKLIELTRKDNSKGLVQKMEKIEIHSLADLALLDPDERLKYEIANEIGLFDKVVEEGWKSLSSKESGRIGGLLSHRKKKMSQG